jgi:hypothetical protein
VSRAPKTRTITAKLPGGGGVRASINTRKHVMDNARSTRKRRRKRDDIAQIKIEVPHVATADWLMEEGHLDAWDQDDPAKLRDALLEYIAVKAGF